MQGLSEIGLKNKKPNINREKYICALYYENNMIFKTMLEALRQSVLLVLSFIKYTQ